jgi:ATP-dependent RNA helicase DDX24/MAK5
MLPGEDSTGSDQEEQFTKNHYDDPKLSRQAEKDLPMNPGEDCAMFFGLEVLDSNQYQVVGTGTSKRLVISGGAAIKSSIDQQHQQPGDQHDDQIDEGKTNEPRKKRKSEKKSKTDGDGNDKVDLPESQTSKSQGKDVKYSRLTSIDEDASSPESSEQHSISPDQLATIQSTWSQASGGASLHTRLLESLCRLGFTSPTPIQATTLAASIMGRRNLVGAAPTGSGKTLAFLLPILNHILEQDETGRHKDDKNNRKSCIQALIMTPTRELATQIHTECDKLLPGHCVTLVGGIALVKQKRLLNTKKPSIVIATPGRLWAMVS